MYRWYIILGLIIVNLFTFNLYIKKSGELKITILKNKIEILDEKLKAIDIQNSGLNKEIELRKKLIYTEQESKKIQQEIANDAMVKIRKAQADANRTIELNNSLHNKITTANDNLSKADKDTIIEYSTTVGNLFDNCITEYRKMAANADEHKINEEYLLNLIKESNNEYHSSVQEP